MLGISKIIKVFVETSYMANYCLLPFQMQIAVIPGERMYEFHCPWWLTKGYVLPPAGTQSTKGYNSPWTRSQPPNQPSPMPAAPLLPCLTAGRGPSPDSPAQSQNPGLLHTLRYVHCHFANFFFLCPGLVSSWRKYDDCLKWITWF